MTTIRTIRTPDDRSVRPGPVVDGSVNQVETEQVSPNSSATQDSIEEARNTRPPPPREKALDLLTADLRTAGLNFLDVSHSSQNAEELAVFVKDETELVKVAEWLAEKGHLDQPRTAEKSARFEFRRPELEAADAGDTTVRVAVAPPVDKAQAALAEEMPNILKVAGARGKAEVAVDGEKLVVKVDAAALDALRTAAGGSFMRPSGDGLSWMGHAVELKASDAVRVGPELTPEEQKGVAEQLGAAWKDGSAIDLRLSDGVAMGPKLEVCGFKANADGFTVRYRPPEPKGGPFQELSSEELFKQGGELSFRPRVDVKEMTPATRAGISQGWVDWIRDTGMVPMHEMWHSQNGSGGTRGPGSGEKFMQFHAGMMEDYKDHLKQTGRADLLEAGGGNLPVWNTADDLPDEFGYADQEKKNIGWTIPSWLTAEGAKQGDETFRLDGREIRSLNDLRSIDELGRALGESGAHAVGHVQLGGQMSGFKSVAVGAFLLWHGLVEVIRDQWLRTDSGQDWTSKHPSAWTSAAANDHMRDMETMSGPHTMAPGISEEQFKDEMKMLSERQRPKS